MVGGGTEGGGGGRESISDRGDDGSTWLDRWGGYRVEKGEGACGDDELGEGGGTCEGGFQGGADGRGCHVTIDGTDPQGERGIPWYWPCGGDVEGSGGNFKYLDYSFHHLPRHPPWIWGRLPHRYRHPRGQTVLEVSGLEVGGPGCDISGPAQGV